MNKRRKIDVVGKDIFSVILKYVNNDDIIPMRLVSKQWRKIIDEDPRWRIEVQKIKRSVRKFLPPTMPPLSVESWDGLPPFLQYIQYAFFKAKKTITPVKKSGNFNTYLMMLRGFESNSVDFLQLLQNYLRIIKRSKNEFHQCAK